MEVQVLYLLCLASIQLLDHINYTLQENNDMNQQNLINNKLLLLYAGKKVG